MLNTVLFLLQEREKKMMGHSYIEEAINAVQWQLSLIEQLLEDMPDSIPIITVPDCRTFFISCKCRACGKPF